MIWTGETAADWLSHRKYSCHHREKKTANFSVPGGATKHLSIVLGRKEGVTAYVNQDSVSGSPYPESGIDGVEVVEVYQKGHKGKNGNPGISDSVARQNPSLDPANNNVLRVHIRDEQSLGRLAIWYRGRALP